MHCIGNKLKKLESGGAMFHNGLKSAFCMNAKHSMESFMIAKQQIDVTKTSSGNLMLNSWITICT